MAFQVSPGVNVSEIDLTSVVPAVAVSVGAIAGVFRWGPVNERVLISNEKQLVSTFGEPTSYFKDSQYTSQWRNYETFFTASNFLNYSNALYVVRTTGGDRVQVATMDFAVADSSITATGADFDTKLQVGDEIEVSGSTSNDGYYKVTSIPSSTKIIVEGVTSSYAIVQDLADAGTFAEGPVVDSGARAAFSTNFQAKYQGRLGNSLAVSYCSTQANGTSAFAAVDAGYTIAITPFDAVNPAIVSGFTTESEAENFADVGDNVILEDGTTLKIESITATQVEDNIGATALNIVNSDANVVDSVTGTGFIFTTGPETVASATQDFTVFQPGETIVISGATAAGNNGTFTVVSAVDDTGGSGNYILTVSGGTLTADAGDANAITITGEPNGSVYTATDTFFIKNHGLTTGDAIQYNVGGGNNDAIDGLEDGTVYYAIVVDTNNFKLATTYENSEAGTAINITSFGGIDGGVTQTFGISDSWSASVTFERVYTGATTYDSGFSVQWADAGLFLTKPTASHVHVVVRDLDGSITGVVNQILEVYEDVSTIPGATKADGSINYLADVLTDQSNYIACSSPSALVATATSEQQSLTLGYDGDDEANIAIGKVAEGYDLYKDASTVDIALVMQGKARGTTLGNYITNNIAESRKDCVAFVSPEESDTTVNAVINFAGTLTGSTYMIVDTGYKYQYDKFNDVYRWVPLNGDIAGLCARTDEVRDPWFSPAGLNRGVIKNVVKLRINPTKAERDLLYVNNVNPVVSEPGAGTILFGDKTFATTASAFDRINVRRLFIVLEKAISIASKSLLFEFNDEFTRAQFKNLVEPFLREVQGRRGIYDFKVVCDETNNTAEVIDGNQFVGDIFIKPARAINFIQLNFVAVRTGVEFEEIVGSV